MEKDLLISVVIVSFNTRDLLRECLLSLMKELQTLQSEIIVVDNGSKDRSDELVQREFPQVILVRSDINLGFAGGNNLGFRHAKGKYIVLLNSDAFIHKGALHLAINNMEFNSEVGLAGAQLLSRDGSWQPSARQFPSIMNQLLLLSGLAKKHASSKFFGRFDRTWCSPEISSEVDWVPGAFAIVKRDVLKQVNYFDERFFFYFEEVDLCRRIKQAGHAIWYWADVKVTHIGGESVKTLKDEKKSLKGSQLLLWQMRSEHLYFRKHHGIIGAYLNLETQLWWHRFRILKNRLFPLTNNKKKIQESQYYMHLIKQGWKDTERGSYSPPKPWKFNHER